MRKKVDRLFDMLPIKLQYIISWPTVHNYSTVFSIFYKAQLYMTVDQSAVTKLFRDRLLIVQKL